MGGKIINRILNFIKKKAFVGENVKYGNGLHIGVMSFISAPVKLEIGSDVYIGKFCSIQCNGTIGDGVLIANNVGVVGRKDHDYRRVGVPIRRSAWVGTDARLASDPKNSVIIERDVWIGFGATVLSGVTIGRGAIIAAGANVVTNVDPYAVFAGNPARQIGTRFNSQDMADHDAALDEMGLR